MFSFKGMCSGTFRNVLVFVVLCFEGPCTVYVEERGLFFSELSQVAVKDC